MSKKKPKKNKKPGFIKAYERDTRHTKEDLEKQLSIKQRLLNRLRFRTVPVPFEDESGKFFIEVRLLSPSEQRRLFGIQQELAKLIKQIGEADSEKKQKTIQKKIETLDDQACEFLGRICVDPELNKDFWKQGEGFSVDVPAKLIHEATRLSVASEEDIRFLLKERRGKGSSSS